MTRFLPTVAMLSATLLAGSLFTAPAAAEDYVSETVTLSYDVAQLDSEVSVESVLRDLKRQARKVCTSTAPLLNVRNVDTACVANVLAQAVEGIDSPSLTAAFEQAEAYKTASLNG